MKDIRTVWQAIVLFSASTFVTSQFGATTSQNDVNYTAKNLQLTVIVGTNHIASETFQLAFYFVNTGNQEILQNDDWEITFSLKGEFLFNQSLYEVHGLQLMPAGGCQYKFKPNSTAQKTFPGLAPKAKFIMTVIAKGLSLYKSDVYPRFVISTANTVPRNIEYTDKDDLSFVVLARGNNSFTDMSTMSGIRRSLTQPDIVDNGRVPPTIIVPAPEMITRPTDNIIDMSLSQKWHIWPDKSVSQKFNNLFKQKMLEIPKVTEKMIKFVNSTPPEGADRIYLQVKPNKNATKDAFKLAIRPRAEGVRDYNLIHMSAPSDTGLNNGLESLIGVVGLFNILPEITIEDDARFGKRSVLLDVTKNFHPASTVKKFISLMKMYKLNNLVINLADDNAWRLELPAEYNFPELVTYASKRCPDTERCLPPAFGSGANTQSSGSGYYNTTDFEGILKHAADRHIMVTPKINVLGALRSAKHASHKRYERLLPTNPTEANRLHLMPANATGNVPDDQCYIDGLMDLCNQEAYTFIGEILKAIKSFYTKQNIPFEEFHAGGDETTQYVTTFPSCQKPSVSFDRTMKNTINRVQKLVKSAGATLRVNEEAVIDPTTDYCLPPRRDFNPGSFLVDFWNIMPGDHEKWGLTEAQWAFVDAPVYQPNETHPIPDPLIPFNGTKKGPAPWSKAYHCANNGYKVVLSPENFFSLDSAYELDFNEPGNRKRERFHTINLHRMMMFEPLNYHNNMDLGNDRYRYLPYRLCYVFYCEPLEMPQNIIGLQASIDSETIRTEDQLWYMTLPRLLLFAERAWRQAPFENILKAEDPRTLMNTTEVDMRAYYLNTEITNFINNFGYKESGRLDDAGYKYRVTRPATSIYFGLPFRVKPPYPVVVKIDIPGADVEYRDVNKPNAKWEPLFTRNETTSVISGGYNFTFPVSDQRIEIRTVSTDRQRGSIPTYLSGSTTNYWPREIPIELRSGMCLPTIDGWNPNMEITSQAQWNMVMTNIDDMMNEETGFAILRETNLTKTLADHNKQYSMNVTMPEVFAAIQNILQSGNDITRLQATNLAKIIFETDNALSQARVKKLEEKFKTLQQEQLQCAGAMQQGAEQPSVQTGRKNGKAPASKGVPTSRSKQVDASAKATGVGGAVRTNAAQTNVRTNAAQTNVRTNAAQTNVRTNAAQTNVRTNTAQSNVRTSAARSTLTQG